MCSLSGETCLVPIHFQLPLSVKSDNWQLHFIPSTYDSIQANLGSSIIQGTLTGGFLCFSISSHAICKKDNPCATQEHGHWCFVPFNLTFDQARKQANNGEIERKFLNFNSPGVNFPVMFHSIHFNLCFRLAFRALF